MSAKQTAKSFWAKVDIVLEGEDSCWVWRGCCNNTGYGTVAWHGQVYTSHRVAAWLSGLVGSPSAPKSTRAKTHVLHKCDNRRCCNPSHMFLGSYSDNQSDAYRKHRRTQPKVTRHVNAKLNVDQIISIRNLYAGGWIQTELAKKFGVSQRAISLIVRGETYK